MLINDVRVKVKKLAFHIWSVGEKLGKPFWKVTW